MLAKQLKISPKEAQVIELCLRGIDNLGDYRWLLIQIGTSLSQDIDVEIGVTEADLWFLRDKINPVITIGSDVSGLGLIIKIYGLLVEFKSDRILKDVKLPPENTAIVVYNESKDNT